MNLSIPQDIAIASFDETPECKFSNPSVTCLSRPLEEIGEEIADTALRLCNGELTEKDITRVFSSRLIIRGSSFSC
jgi:DNA-binding LacI/PurR family transcriptional regulator